MTTTALLRRLFLAQRLSLALSLVIKTYNPCVHFVQKKRAYWCRLVHRVSDRYH